MNINVQRDFKKATLAYLKNKDVIQENFHGKLINIELDSKQLSRILDQSASTDVFYVDKKNMVFAVAMRFNFNFNWHNKVTIRYKRSSGSLTEYQKTINAFKNNSITASIGVQVDSDDNFNIYDGIIYDRKKLFHLIESNPDYFEEYHMHIVNEDKNKMLYFHYDFFRKNNIKHMKFKIKNPSYLF